MKWFYYGLLVIIFLGGAIVWSPLKIQGTVNEVTVRNDYTGNGSNTEFSYAVRIRTKYDVGVLVDGTTKTVDTDYALSGLGDSLDGTVSYATVPASGRAVTLLTKWPIEKTTNYIPNQTFSNNAKRIKKDLDKAIMTQQMQSETINRSLKLPKKSTLPGNQLEMPMDTCDDGDVMWNVTTTGFECKALTAKGTIATPITPVTGGTGIDNTTGLTKGSLLAAGTAGRIARVMDDVGEIGLDQRTQWFSLSGDVANVQKFGAVGDGVADDTSAIQAALDKVPANGIVVFPPGTYKVGAVRVKQAMTIRGPAQINLSGASAGFELAANITGLRFQDLTITGDGVLANNHRFIWHDKTNTISDVVIDNIAVNSCVQNIDLGGLTDVLVTHSTIKSAAGTASGQGYGIVAGRVKRVRIVENFFEDNGRHAFYSREGIDIIFQGNVIRDHTKTAGGSTAAVNLVENQRVSIVGNLWLDSQARDLSLDDDINTTDFAREYVITGNVFSSASGNLGGLVIGASAPAATTNLLNVLVQGNVFKASPSRQNGIINIKSGKNISIIGNEFYENATTATPIAVYLTGGTDAYYDRIYIGQNSGNLGNNANNSRLVEMSTNLSTGSTDIVIKYNHVTVDNEQFLIFYLSTPTNPNIVTDWSFEKAVTLSSGSQTLSIAGYNHFAITGGSGGSTITDFTNGRSGQTISLRFTDANVTVTRDNAFLSGGVNFVSTSDDFLTLKRYRGFWTELYRSVNS